MIVKLLTEHHLEFLSLKGGCRGLSESTLVQSHIVGSHMSRLICKPSSNLLFQEQPDFGLLYLLTARHIYPSLVLIQPRKTRPCLTLFSRQKTLASPLQITWIWVSMSLKSLPKQLRHLVSFAGIWLLHLGVQRKLHTKLWFGLN